jgi:hypothetical protein
MAPAHRLSVSAITNNRFGYSRKFIGADLPGHNQPD